MSKIHVYNGMAETVYVRKLAYDMITSTSVEKAVGDMVKTVIEGNTAAKEFIEIEADKTKVVDDRNFWNPPIGNRVYLFLYRRDKQQFQWVQSDPDTSWIMLPDGVWQAEYGSTERPKSGSWRRWSEATE